MSVLREYQCACEKVIKWFTQQTDTRFEGWVGDEVGGVAEISGEFHDFGDLVTLLEFAEEGNDVEELITKYADWYTFVMDCYECHLQYVNLKSYLNGYPTENMHKAIEHIQIMRRDLEEEIKKAQAEYGKANESGFPDHIKEIKENLF